MLPAVVIAQTCDVLRDRADVDAVLSSDERDRLAALSRQEDREDFIAARVAMRVLVQRFRPGMQEAVFEQRCSTCGGPHGRPTIPGHADLALSWSHASGVVAAALDTSPIGVDVAIVNDSGPPILPRVGGVGGWARWTRTEALVKRGDGTLFEVRGWPLVGSLEEIEVEGVMTEFVAEDGSWVASVAAASKARLVALSERAN